MQTANAPKKICIIRLSAIGDVAQTFIAINELKQSQPQLQLTWIIGKAEYELLKHIDDIDFIVFDKTQVLKSYRLIARRLFGEKFDALLLMQYSIRASLLSLLVRATRRIGYPRPLAREGHSLFTNQCIEMPSNTPNPHVLDIYYGFAKALGLTERADVIPSYYLPDDADFARRNSPSGKKTLLLSPCSSHHFKNWLPQRYAEVAQAAMQQYDMHVVLVGADNLNEKIYAQQIQQHLSTYCFSLVGKTSLRQLAALVARSDLVIAPDSAIVHIASALRTPVIGLYAATDAERSGPYRYLDLCVNRYPEAVEKYLHKSTADVRWGKHIKKSNAMELISSLLVIEQIGRVINAD